MTKISFYDIFIGLKKGERLKMQIYEELVKRGLIAQVTDEKEIKDLINNGKATFYIGFDPTAEPSCRSFYGTLPYEKTSNGR